MTDVLIVNHGLSPVCGIHDLGVRMFNAIPDSIAHAYAEANSAAELLDALATHTPAVMIVNYRADLMPWMNVALRSELSLAARAVAVAHNYEPHSLGQVAVMHRWIGFDTTLALEPWLGDFEHVEWSGRPIPPPLRIDVPEVGAPVIGSFGFAFGHKRFDLVAREVRGLDRRATFRLHCPTAHFGGTPEHTEAVLASVRSELDGSLVTLQPSTDHRPADRVVRMLAANHANCLLYEPGQPDAGLSSALDYLLAAGRPILVSEASMFRHARPAALAWPEHHLGDLLWLADRHAVNVRERADQLSAGYAAGIKRLLERA